MLKSGVVCFVQASTLNSLSHDLKTEFASVVQKAIFLARTKKSLLGVCISITKHLVLKLNK